MHWHREMTVHDANLPRYVHGCNGRRHNRNFSICWPEPSHIRTVFAAFKHSWLALNQSATSLTQTDRLETVADASFTVIGVLAQMQPWCVKTVLMCVVYKLKSSGPTGSIHTTETKPNPNSNTYLHPSPTNPIDCTNPTKPYHLGVHYNRKTRCGPKLYESL